MDKVGVRTRRQREQMGDGLRGGKRLRSQLNELMREAERGFMVAERACGAMVSNFVEEAPEEENANIWGEKIREKAKSLEISCERGLCRAVESTHGEPVNWK